MILVKAPLRETVEDDHQVIGIPADRRELSKRRWRGVAEDGTEFGFDLQHGLEPDAVVHRADGKLYRIEQRPESVLEIPLREIPHSAEALAWQIGNLHFPLEISSDGLRTVDDPATRQMLERLGIHYHPASAVFRPLVAVAGHGAHHHVH